MKNNVFDIYLNEFRVSKRIMWGIGISGVILVKNWMILKLFKLEWYC